MCDHNSGNRQQLPQEPTQNCRQLVTTQTVNLEGQMYFMELWFLLEQRYKSSLWPPNAETDSRHQGEYACTRGIRAGYQKDHKTGLQTFCKLTHYQISTQYAAPLQNKTSIHHSEKICHKSPTERWCKKRLFPCSKTTKPPWKIKPEKIPQLDMRQYKACPCEVLTSLLLNQNLITCQNHAIQILLESLRRPALSFHFFALVSYSSSQVSLGN
jgi:hypothetical protein